MLARSGPDLFFNSEFVVHCLTPTRHLQWGVRATHMYISAIRVIEEFGVGTGSEMDGMGDKSMGNGGTAERPAAMQ